jgi:hypothetical protein
MFIRGLLFQWIGTINIKLSVFERHSDTLSWFRVNHSSLLLLKAACIAEKHQMAIWQSLVLPERGHYDNHYNTAAVRSSWTSQSIGIKKKSYQKIVWSPLWRCSKRDICNLRIMKRRSSWTQFWKLALTPLSDALLSLSPFTFRPSSKASPHTLSGSLLKLSKRVPLFWAKNISYCPAPLFALPFHIFLSYFW